MESKAVKSVLTTRCNSSKPVIVERMPHDKRRCSPVAFGATKNEVVHTVLQGFFFLCFQDTRHT